MLTMLALVTARAEPLDPAAFTLLDDRFDSPGRMVIDTDEPTLSVGETVLYTGVVVDGIAVFTFGTVRFDEDLEVVGSLPLAILSTGDLRLEAGISASAHRAVPGPGGSPGGASTDGETGGGPGGGEAAAGAGGGGFGGAGGNGEFEGAGGPPYGDLDLQLQGGSGGARAVLFPPVVGLPSGAGGAGGGAIEIVAVGRLDVASTASIHVDGGEGEASEQDGGGAGSGGAILIRGGGGRCEGLLSARGGVGGAKSKPLFSFGGGGGGGRVAIYDLDEACPSDVGGGDSGGNRGSPGIATSGPYVAPEPEPDTGTIGVGVEDDTGPAPPEVPDRSAAGEGMVVRTGCACGSTGGPGGWALMAIALAIGRRPARPTLMVGVRTTRGGPQNVS